MKSVAVTIRFSLSSMASAMMDRWIVSGVGFAFFYEGLIAVTIFNLASFLFGGQDWLGLHDYDSSGRCDVRASAVNKIAFVFFH